MPARPTEEFAFQLTPWIEKARSGSAQALGELLEGFRPYLLAIANTELPGEVRAKVAASDLVQETFLEAQRDFGGFQGKSTEELTAWLRRILLNNLFNADRHYCGTEKRQVGRELSLDGPRSDAQLQQALVDEGHSPRSDVIHREEAEALAKAMERLPENYRRAVVLRQQANKSFAEIGAEMNCSAEAARKLWSRAIERLREELG